MEERKLILNEKNLGDANGGTFGSQWVGFACAAEGSAPAGGKPVHSPATSGGSLAGEMLPPGAIVIMPGIKAFNESVREDVLLASGEADRNEYVARDKNDLF